MNTTKTYHFFLLFVLFLIVPHLFYAQSSNIGIPPITNFSKKTYNAGPQNWDIAQSKQGLMYFANNGGLLEFDGVNWQCYGISNQTNIRSLAIAKNGYIYIGAQGDFGYFYPNEIGNLEYQSLIELVPKSERGFADVWDIEILGESLFYRTGDKIFLYKDNEIKSIYISNNLSYSKVIGGHYYIHDIDKGLLKFDGETFNNLETDPTFINKEISGIFEFKKDTLLIFTIQNSAFLYANGIFKPWQINDNNVLKNSNIYCSAKINATTFAIGTSTKGIFIVNNKGQVVQHITRTAGLQKNNLLSLFSDQSNNLWVGLNNGIDYIETSSPFTYIQPDNNLLGMGYAVQIHNDKIYFGTSSALYQKDWQSYYNPITTSDYKMIPNSRGQVWNLLQFRDELLLHHHNGTFVVKNGVARKISSELGSWLQLPIAENKDVLIGGYYTGLATFKWKNGWKEAHRFDTNWKESCRIMVQDEHSNIWVSHPYRGAYRVEFNADFSELGKVTLYNSGKGFPSDLQIYVFKIGDEAVFCASKGIYSYNPTKDRFESNEKWNKIFGIDTWVKRLIEAPNGDVWFVTEHEVGVLEVTDGGIYKKVNKRTFPQLKNKLVGGFETIYPYDKENVFFAYENGFIHFNPQQEVADTNFNVHIRLVQLENNAEYIFKGSHSLGKENANKKEGVYSLDYEQNALRFTFSSTYFNNIESNEYQYFLEGFDEKWSDWTTKTEKEYTNLNSGSYKFHVRSRNIHGHFSEIASYSFKVFPPWYASKFALTVYSLLLLGGLFLLILIPQKKFEREKAALQSEQEQTLLQKEQEHQRLVEARQKQISKLEKEKLELQIQSQNQELASSTMHLAQKSEMLKKLKEDLQKIVKAAPSPEVAKQLRKVIRKVSADETLDKDWKQFAKHFDQVHGNFLKRLREKHPQLTPKDHRLCAYLRMNLSSKEIAPLLNISVRGVEIARYRLRKRLEIGGDVNLINLMLKI